MTENLIAGIISGTVHDPDGGPNLSVPTRSVAIEKSLDGREADLIHDLGLTSRIAIVSDRITREVLGERVQTALSAHGRVKQVVLPGIPHADTQTVERLRSETAQSDALIAVGSGTINDLCKYASALDDKPYAVFATAPSMNGYTSVNAAITFEGLKKTVPAQGASGIFVDLQVFADSPKRMIISGFGDSICRPTAQCDWLLSHLLHGTAYREAPFDILAADEEALLYEPEALMSGDLEAMERLARTLILSGFGMTICGSSAPASQGEHMISHLMDMLPPPGWQGAFHGEQIAVTTLTIARLQERILANGRPRLSPTVTTEENVRRIFGDALGRKCWQEFSPKRLTATGAEQLNDLLEHHWDGFRERLLAVSRSADRLEPALRRAGAPVRPEDIGLSREYYEQAVLHARTIRNRYCFLDFASDAGMLSHTTVGEF